MEKLVLYAYTISQFIIFLIYIPHIRKIIKSETADAISVPAQLCFFTTGAIAAIYMWVVNDDLLATLIICAHILVGNLLIALIALRKQRREVERKEKETP